jgi:hypothetical protein
MDGSGVANRPGKQENGRQDGQRRRKGIDAPKGRSSSAFLLFGWTFVACVDRGCQPGTGFGGVQCRGIERRPGIRRRGGVGGVGGHPQLRSN